MTPEQARQFLAENKVKFVLAQFVDIHGVAKTKAVPASHFDDILNLSPIARIVGMGLHKEELSPVWVSGNF